jgi:hypothetical protein
MAGKDYHSLHRDMWKCVADMRNIYLFTTGPNNNARQVLTWFLH